MRAGGLTRAADDPHIAAWRQAFSAFGAKPSKYPSSAEALAARVLKGQPLPRINRLVDLYNAVSIRHLLPVGGEDSDHLAGPLRLVIAQGDEPFDQLDDSAAELSDGLRALCPDAAVSVRKLSADQPDAT